METLCPRNHMRFYLRLLLFDWLWVFCPLYGLFFQEMNRIRKAIFFIVDFLSRFRNGLKIINQGWESRSWRRWRFLEEKHEDLYAFNLEPMFWEIVGKKKITKIEGETNFLVFSLMNFPFGIRVLVTRGTLMQIAPQSNLGFFLFFSKLFKNSEKMNF